MEFNTEKEYCPHCEETVDAIKTLSWQDNVCDVCGNSIPADE